MVEIHVCIGTSCHLNGSYNVVQTFQQLIEEYGLHDKVDIKAYFCMKKCGNQGVSVSVDDASYRIEPENAHDFFKDTILERV